jgi:hypothetical protein
VFMQNGIAQGWGQVPYNATVRCWCANDVGTLANVSDDCVAQACPFPGRCVAAWPEAATANGTVCAAGADGPLCTVCITRWYKFRDEVRSRYGCCGTPALVLTSAHTNLQPASAAPAPLVFLSRSSC